jgi:hypothetical protein
MRRLCSQLAVASLLAAIGVPAAATEERPMPAFSVMGADGSVVDSGQLSTMPQYVLMYVAPNCRPCDRLLGLIATEHSPEFTSRIVVLVRGDAKAASDYLAPQIPTDAGRLTWYADASELALQTLRLTGTPVLIGVRQGRVIWSVSGVLNDASTVESIVRSWVTY